MTYYELIKDAEHKLNFNKITLGEYEEMIKPLKREIEQQPSEDCISREAAIKQCGFGMTHLLIADCLRRLPSITPKAKTGQWESASADDGIESCWCSQCFNYAPLMPDDSFPNYCPHCGAKMEVEAND